MLSNGDWYAGSGPYPVPSYTAAANTTLVLTVAYFNSTTPMTAGNVTALTGAGWTEVAAQNGGGVGDKDIYCHIFKKNVGGSGETASIADIDNSGGVGIAYSLVEISGSVTGLGTIAVSVDTNQGTSATEYSVPDISTGYTAGNSTYIIAISGAVSAGTATVKSGQIHGIFADPNVTYLDHVLTPGETPGQDPYDLGTARFTYGSGSSNQHYFVSGDKVNEATTYTEVAADNAKSTTLFAFEVLGDGAAAPVINDGTDTVSAITTDGMTLNFDTDTNSGTVYWVASQNDADHTGITTANLKAGQIQGGTAAAAGQSGSFTVSSTSVSQALSGLGFTENSTAAISYYQEDAALESNIATILGANFAVPFDAPVLSSPTVTGNTTAGVTLGASTDKTSGSYWLVIGAAGTLDTVSVAQIKAGQIQTGAAAISSAANIAISASPFTRGYTDALTDNSSFQFALVQTANGIDSAILKGTFIVGVVNNHAFRMPMTDADTTQSAAETGLVVSVYSDAALSTQVGSDFTSAAIDGSGELVINATDLGANGTLTQVYWVRVRRVAASSAHNSAADNRDFVYQATCVDVDVASNKSI